MLFLVIFFWTPPHYWPLSMKVRDDYARVGVPMLPVVAGNLAVARQIVLYSWVMVAVSLLLVPLGLRRLVLPGWRSRSGGWWLWEAHALHARAKSGAAGAKLKEMRLFHWSITYVVAAVRRGGDRPVPALTPPAPDSGPALPAAASTAASTSEPTVRERAPRRTEGPDP